MMTPFPQPDRGAAAAFIDAIFRYASEETYVNLRAFHDLKDGAPPLFIEPVKIGASDFIERVCERIQEAAAHPEPHVFCPPVCTFNEPNGAAVANLAEGLALTVECDSNALSAYKKLVLVLRVRPTAVVASGGVWENPETKKPEPKLHLHWRLTEPTQTAEEHAKLYEARALAAELVGADRSNLAIVHPLRWPGSWHRKDPNKPRIARLKTNPDSEIELGEALERLREACPPKARTGNGHDKDEEGRELTAPLGELAAAMAVIPNADASWEVWNRIGMALWVASSGQGFEAFDSWSRRSSKYDAETTKARWEHYATSPPRRIGAGTVFHLANEVDPDWRSKHAAAEKAAKCKAESEEQALLEALARKSTLQYDRERKQAAKKLGIRPSTLDDAVRALRDEIEAKEQPALHPWWQVEPWQHPVEIAALLIELQEQILKYVVITKEQALAVALWVVMAWVHDRAVVHSPFLMVTSPQRDSGKSTLLGIIGFLVPRSLTCAGLNEAVLFRSIDFWTPTLITDEADSMFVDNEPLRAVFNSGWTRGTGVPRCVGDNHVPKLFSTFCPRVLGLKGKNLSDTTLSRCIVIELKRKLPNETVADFAHMDDAIFATLRRKLARWADDRWEGLFNAQPQIPAGFHNRIRRNWWLLLAIAEMAGDEWGQMARKAAAAVEGACDVTDTEIELLADARSIFDTEDVNEITTKSLIAKLCQDEERPWATFFKGNKITDRQLARMLRKYGIVSEDVYPNGTHAKGYKRAGFKDAWARYSKDTSPA
jgi:hypothetical protein